MSELAPPTDVEALAGAVDTIVAQYPGESSIELQRLELSGSKTVADVYEKFTLFGDENRNTNGERVLLESSIDYHDGSYAQLAYTARGSSVIVSGKEWDHYETAEGELPEDDERTLSPEEVASLIAHLQEAKPIDTNRDTSKISFLGRLTNKFKS